MTFFDKAGQPVRGDGVEAVSRVYFSRRIAGGPVDHGFDRFFGTACCPTTDWLDAFIENDRVPVPPEGPLNKSWLPKHPYANVLNNPKLPAAAAPAKSDAEGQQRATRGCGADSEDFVRGFAVRCDFGPRVWWALTLKFLLYVHHTQTRYPSHENRTHLCASSRAAVGRRVV